LSFGPTGSAANDISVAGVSALQSAYDALVSGLPAALGTLSPIAVSGVYDGTTKDAIQNLQARLRSAGFTELTADGIAGHHTLQAMDELLNGLDNGWLTSTTKLSEILAMLLAGPLVT
jgi:hypothetical protein